MKNEKNMQLTNAFRKATPEERENYKTRQDFEAQSQSKPKLADTENIETNVRTTEALNNLPSAVLAESDGIVSYQNHKLESIEGGKQPLFGTPVTESDESNLAQNMLQTNILTSTNNLNQFRYDMEEQEYDQTINLPAVVMANSSDGKKGSNLPKRARYFGAKKDDVNPAKMANVLINKYHIAIYKNMVLLYDPFVNYYRFLSQEEMKRVIKAAYDDLVIEIGSDKLIQEIYNFIFMEKKLVKEDSWLRQSYDIVSFKNGVFVPQTRQFYPPNPNYFALHAINHTLVFDKELTCPIFDQFVINIAGNDDVLVKRIWQCIGYILSNDMRGRALIIFQGESGSGKSTLGNFLVNLLPVESTQSIHIDDIANNFAIAELFGKALIVDLDLPKGALNERTVGSLKSLTGGDAVGSDVKYGHRFTFYPTGKIVLATNNEFHLKYEDEALMNRIVVVPFNIGIPRGQWDTKLPEKIYLEKNAIILKALQYYCTLVDDNYIFAGTDRFFLNENIKNSVVKSEFNKTLYYQSQIMDFVIENFEFTQNPADIVLLSEIRNLFWAMGYDQRHEIDANVFSRIIYEKFSDCIERTRTRKNVSNHQKNPEPAFTKMRLKPTRVA